ncbi:MAG: hypothetical protein ACREQV_23425 [Candidatus Binatia bacterium]
MGTQVLHGLNQIAGIRLRGYRFCLRRLILLGLIAAGLVQCVCAPPLVEAQVKSNLSSSVTSESMTHVWVARDRGLF